MWRRPTAPSCHSWSSKLPAIPARTLPRLSKRSVPQDCPRRLDRPEWSSRRVTAWPNRDPLDAESGRPIQHAGPLVRARVAAPARRAAIVEERLKDRSRSCRVHRQHRHRPDTECHAARLIGLYHGTDPPTRFGITRSHPGHSDDDPGRASNCLGSRRDLRADKSTSDFDVLGHVAKALLLALVK